LLFFSLNNQFYTAEIETENGGGKKLLFFDTNSAGIFSQFLQMKAMYKKVKEMGYNLVLSPTKSKHYENVKVNLCDIFELPQDSTMKM